MKVKTSITLSREVLTAVDRLTGSSHSRSSVIERALRKYLREHKRAEIHAHDLQILNRAADVLTRRTRIGCSIRLILGKTKANQTRRLIPNLQTSRRSQTLPSGCCCEPTHADRVDLFKRYLRTRLQSRRRTSYTDCSWDRGRIKARKLDHV